MSSWKKNTFIFLGSQAISLLGSSLVQYAITWHITLTTQSGVMMTISILCSFLPTFLLSPFAGVWADRYSRKRIILISDGVVAAGAFLLAVAFFLGYREIWLLFVMAAVRSIGGGLQSPAVSAYLPQMAPQEQLTKVNAWNGSLQSVIMLISPMASGALLAFSSLEIMFMIDVVTAIIAMIVLSKFLHVPLHQNALTDEKKPFLEDFKQGIQYIWKHSFLRSFCFFEFMFMVLAVPIAFLTPLQVTRNYGDTVWYLSGIEIAFSLGMIVGGLVIASWGGFKNKTHSMVVSNILFGVVTFALGFAIPFWIYIVYMVIGGLLMPLFNTPSLVLIQQKVEGDYLGRVFGVITMISSSVMPLGMLFFGPLADYVTIEQMLIVTGIFIFVLGVAMRFNRPLIEAGKPIIPNLQQKEAQ